MGALAASQQLWWSFTLCDNWCCREKSSWCCLLVEIYEMEKCGMTRTKMSASGWDSSTTLIMDEAIRPQLSTCQILTALSENVCHLMRGAMLWTYNDVLTAFMIMHCKRTDSHQSFWAFVRPSICYPHPRLWHLAGIRVQILTWGLK